MIFLVIIMTINGQDFERREPMPDAPTCFARAAERFEEIRSKHRDAVGIGVGCTLTSGDPV
jgi:hypothetical protein